MSGKPEKFVPIWRREKNRFLRFEEVAFGQTETGLTGHYVVAHYIDKKGRPKTEVARVIWDVQPFSKEHEALLARLESTRRR